MINLNLYTDRVGAELGGPIDIRLKEFQDSWFREKGISVIVQNLNGAEDSILFDESFKELYPLAIEKFKAIEFEKFSKKAVLFTCAKMDSYSIISLLPLELILIITNIQKSLFEPLSIEKFIENQERINWLNCMIGSRQKKAKEGLIEYANNYIADLKIFTENEDEKLAAFQKSQQESCQIQ